MNTYLCVKSPWNEPNKFSIFKIPPKEYRPYTDGIKIQYKTDIWHLAYFPPWYQPLLLGNNRYFFVRSGNVGAITIGGICELAPGAPGWDWETLLATDGHAKGYKAMNKSNWKLLIIIGIVAIIAFIGFFIFNQIKGQGNPSGGEVTTSARIIAGFFA